MATAFKEVKKNAKHEDGGGAGYPRPSQREGPAGSPPQKMFLSEARALVRENMQGIDGDGFRGHLMSGRIEAKHFFTRFSKGLDGLDVLLASPEAADRKLARTMLGKFCAACKEAQEGLYKHRNFVSDEAAGRGRELLARATSE
jgi:hypothetical protein